MTVVLDEDLSHRPGKAKSAVFVHLMTGIALLSKGLSALSHPEAPPALAGIGIGGGVLVLACVALHKRRRGVRHFDAMVYLLEGAVAVMVGVASLQRGTDFIQYAWFVASVGFLTAAIVNFRRLRTMPALRESVGPH